MSRPERELAWVAQGQALLERTVLALDELAGPSRLPGWSRGHVVTHVARNAEGLGRLLSWARTGIETPMYPSIQARDADIEAGAGRSQAEQLDDLHRTAAAFADAAQRLSLDHWQATVRTRHGPMPARAVPWARARELWLHVVDLDAGVEIDVMPADVATMLVHDVAEWMHAHAPVRIALQVPSQEPIIFGPVPSIPLPVSGPVQQLAGWLTGRCSGDRLTAPDGLPELPRWL